MFSFTEWLIENEFIGPPSLDQIGKEIVQMYLTGNFSMSALSKYVAEKLGKPPTGGIVKSIISTYLTPEVKEQALAKRQSDRLDSKKRCECGNIITVKGDRYCKPCFRAIKDQMVRDGYLTQTNFYKPKYRSSDAQEDRYATKYGKYEHATS